MKTKISLFLIFIFVLVCSVPKDSPADSPDILDLKELVNQKLDFISDRICCYSNVCTEGDRPEDCTPRVSDAAICGECRNRRTGEVGIYTQDLSQPHPDTTFADALGNLITYNNKIRNEITTITSKQMKLKKSMRSFEMKQMLESANLTKKEKIAYESAMKTADTLESDLAILYQLQTDIYKLSSDLFLLTISNQFKKVE